MADAVPAPQFLVPLAAIALVFIVVLALVLCFALVARAVDCYRRADAEVEQAIAETLSEPAAARAVRDTEHGIRLDWQDECELLYAMPAHKPTDPELAAGRDPLQDSIPDEQQKGETA